MKSEPTPRRRIGREDLDEYKACLALKHTPGLGPRTWKRLLEAYGSAGEACLNADSWLGRELAKPDQLRSFRSRAWYDDSMHELEAAAGAGARLLLWTDDRYPERLRHIPDPPLFLYYLGRASFLTGPAVAVVGSRTCSAAGLLAARKISLGLSEAGLTVVSGMAKGIDRQAHLAALEGPGGSIAVLGCGVDVVYPPVNDDVYMWLRESGLLLSEFAPGSHPDGRNFPRRNRIISGLSMGVLLVEAPVKSGGRITSAMAAEQGREVYAVSGPEGAIGFQGCRNLIAQGAKAVESAGEIILDLAPLLQAEIDDVERKMATGKPAPAPKPLRETKPTIQDDEASMPLLQQLRQMDSPTQGQAGEHDEAVATAAENEEEAELLNALAALGDQHIDELSRKLDRDTATLSRTLLLLEMRGLVRQLPGMRYQAVGPKRRAQGEGHR